MAAFLFNTAKPILLDEAFPDGDYVCGLFCNSADFANYSAITHVDTANGYAEQALSAWGAASLNGSSEGEKKHIVTFAHDGSNFTSGSGSTDPANIYGVYVAKDSTEHIMYHVFSGGPINIGPTYYDNIRITLEMLLT